MPVNHSKRDDPPGWMLCLLIALIAAGLTVAVAAYCIPIPKDPPPERHP